MTPDADSADTLTVLDIPERCGNAPRKAVIRDFTIALVRRDADEVTSVLSEQVRWVHAGDRPLVGHQEVSARLSMEPAARELKINTVITHGTECGVDGVVTYVDGTAAAFSHIMRFSGGAKTAKITELRSYVVPLDAKPTD